MHSELNANVFGMNAGGVVGCEDGAVARIRLPEDYAIHFTGSGISDAESGRSLLLDLEVVALRGAVA
jgi:hypothetical protein